MQFGENLSDHQAADTVRARMDWKYALSLELTDSGFHYSVLSEFRSRLVAGEAGEGLLDILLERFVARGWIKRRGQQRTDSTAILAAVRELNQLEIVGETMRYALNNLATVEPDWLQTRVPEEWFDCYKKRFEEYRLPSSKSEDQQLSIIISEDGYQLLEWVYQSDAALGLHDLPAVEIMRQVWIQQYWIDQDQVKRREPKQMLPVGQWIRSPFDPQARYGRKRGWDWVGYKLHLTEVCDVSQPHIITQVETVAAIQQDHHALAGIQTDLAKRDLLPNQQLVDAGYVSAKRIIDSQKKHQINLVDPVHIDPSWQARTPEAYYDLSVFTVDWDHKVATCPEGQPSKHWNPPQDAKRESIVQIVFDQATCANCLSRELCTRATKSGRSMTLRAPRNAMICSKLRVNDNKLRIPGNLSAACRH